MNRSYINKKNAQQIGYNEGIKFLNSIFATTYEFYMTKGQEIADSLYSDATRRPFYTGWMNAWEVRHAHKQETPKQETPKIETQPTFKFTNTLVSALSILDFSNVPEKKALILKYRDLAKVHHPDHGGLHQNMIAINLAYDYVKKFY